MKKITVIAAAVLVLAACQSKKQKSQNTATEIADSCAVIVEEQVNKLDSAAQEAADTLVAVIKEVAE